MEKVFNIIRSIREKRKNKGRLKLPVLVLLLSLFLITGCSSEEAEEIDLAEEDKIEVSQELEPKEEEGVDESEELAEGGQENIEMTSDLKVHYIDVGQGDAIFIELPNGETALIDGGPGSSKDALIDYLRGLEFRSIDYLVATHPHEDHIGGLPEVIRNFEIGKIYMPAVTHTTKIFEELIGEIENKNLSINATETGTILIDEPGLNLWALAPDPNTSGSNLNDYSIVLRLDYEDTSFMFTGDGEKVTEQYLLADNSSDELRVNVLKLGHHGSDTSSIQPFIDTVNPEHAVITCGVDNKYGHPSPSVLARLDTAKIEVHRTDTDGTIVITSDGKKLSIVKEGNPLQANAPPKEDKKEVKETNSSKSTQVGQGEVYVTKTGSKYHKRACGNGNYLATTLDKAIARGLEPCKRCY